MPDPDEQIAGSAAEAGQATDLSLREELAAALSADSGDAAPAAQTPAAQGEPAPAVQQPRAADGKFAKPGEAVQKQPSEPNALKAPGEPSSPTAIVPPASWSAAAKADFVKLAPHIQQEVLKREKDIETGAAQWQSKGERLNRLDQILAPRRERFQLAGIDETQAIQALFAAQDYLERDPVNALIYLARQSGVDLRQLAMGLGGQQPQQAQLPPQLQPLVQQVQTLSQAFSQQQAQAVEAKRSEHLNLVQAFASDPKNVYFENVRERMGNLIRAGLAKDLSDAYSQATWSDPTIRPLLERQAQEDQAAARQSDARAKAEAARRASGSVIGSPSPGATPGQGSPAPTLREELQAAWNSAA